jgi:chorismate--pyruvate lyase
LPKATKSLRWLSLQQLPADQRPNLALRRWLLDKNSLTAKLIALSGHAFHVEIVQQSIAVPQRDERQLLGMKDKQVALVREVVLYGCNQPWVFARSLLPLSSLEGELRHLRKQGNRPLGAFLFSQPHLQRGAIAVSAISRDHGYLPKRLASADPVWGRRSVFSLSNQPLLVSEVFLASFTEALASTTMSSDSLNSGARHPKSQDYEQKR